MARQICDAIETLPPYTEPIFVVAVDVFRDGGSVEVTLRDAHAQSIVLFFDCAIGTHPPGRPYLKANTTPCLRPIALNSSAEAQAVRLLWKHLNEHYTFEEQARLTALECSVRGLSQNDYEGRALLRCLEQAAELHKLVTMGVVSYPVSFRSGGE